MECFRYFIFASEGVIIVKLDSAVVFGQCFGSKRPALLRFYEQYYKNLSLWPKPTLFFLFTLLSLSH